MLSQKMESSQRRSLGALNQYKAPMEVTSSQRRSVQKSRGRRQSNIKSRFWCFTLNNPEEGSCKYNEGTMSYMIAGVEGKEEGKTPHIQGFIVFRKRQRLTAVKKVFRRAHWEIMRSTTAQSITYCQKEGDYKEFGGEFKTQAQISKKNMQKRWLDAWNLSKAGDIEKIEPMMRFRYYSNCKQIKMDHPPKLERNKEFDNHWIIAPTGYGKSYYAREMWPDYYDKSMDKWWIGYAHESMVLLDDFGPEEGLYMGPWLKRWSDLYSFKGDQKYAGGTFRPKTFVVTSQYSISQCFKDAKLVLALERRFETKYLEHYNQRTQAVLMSGEDTDILGLTESIDEEIQQTSNEELITQEKSISDDYFVEVLSDDDEYYGSVIRRMSANTNTTHDMIKAFDRSTNQ